MKLNIAINALAASVSSLPASASASGAVAKNARDDRAEEGSIRAAASKNQGAECYFAVGIEVQNSPDVGVLSCNAGEMCVEDSMSSIGGRCVVPGNEVFLSGPGGIDTYDYALDRSYRFACEPCSRENGKRKWKCCGTSACALEEVDNIPCGSCIGVLACANIKGTIGKDSCIGFASSEKAQG